VDLSWIPVAFFLLLLFGGISAIGALNRIRDAVEEIARNTRRTELSRDE
jgi:hypothetical protein